MKLSFSTLAEHAASHLKAKGYTDLRSSKVELERHNCGQYKLWFYANICTGDPYETQSLTALSDYFSIEDFAVAENKFITKVGEALVEFPTQKELSMKKLMNAMEKARELSEDLNLPDEFRAQIEESITSLSTNILEKK